jgi:uncharacterized membrane protein YdjX (TVP38/TMEM64 family)
MKKFWRWLPLLIIVILMVIIYSLGVTDYIDYELLKKHRQAMLTFVEKHYLASPLIYMGIYIVGVALSVPGATILTILGGFLFGQPWSTMYTVVAATIGATCIFLAARTALAPFFKEKAAPFLKKMEKGFNENAGSYLLFLRFVPIFPFWIINIAPAFFNVWLRTYVWTTFVGIIPGTFVYSQAGTGLGAILDSGKDFSIETIFNLQMKIALVALAVFSLIPIIVKKVRSRAR